MWRARILLLFAVVIWGWSFVATKLALVSVTPLELLGLRMLFGMPVLLLLAVVRKVDWRIGRGNLCAALLGSAVITVHFVIQITGLITASATNTGWIITGIPLALAVLSWLLLGERISRSVLVGIVVSTLGVLLLISRGDWSSLAWLRSTGDWLVLLSTVTWAAYTITIRKLSQGVDPLVVTIVVLAPTTAFSLGWMALTTDPAKLLAMPPLTWAAILFLGVLATALAQWFWQAGVARLGAANAGVYLYLEPLATIAIAIPFLGERINLAGAIGAALVVAGVWVAQRVSPGS